MNSAAPATGIGSPSTDVTVNFDVHSLDSIATGQSLPGVGNLEMLTWVLPFLPRRTVLETSRRAMDK